MDWQHLLMNGESLGEYAALLAEGLLGHQHANSGGGLSTTTTWSAQLPSWRRWSWRSSSAGRATATTASARVRPLPVHEDAVEAVRRSVLQWRFIDEVAGRIDDAALREAQMEKDAVRAYELVYAALGA